MSLHRVSAKTSLDNVLTCKMFRPELSEPHIMMARGRSGKVCKTGSRLTFWTSFECNATYAWNMRAMDKKRLLCEAGLDFMYTTEHLMGLYKQ